MMEGTLLFTNADRTWPWKASWDLATNNQNIETKSFMKTNASPGSSVNHSQTLTSGRADQIPIKPAWQKKLAWSLGISLTLALALLFSQEAKSEGNLQVDGYGLEGSWINTASPILPPGVPPVTLQTYVTVSRGGAWLGSDRTKPFASPQHGTWVHVQGNEYAWTFVQDLFDSAGTFLGTFKGRSRVELVGKNEFVGVANVEQRDPEGNVVLNRCARFRGVRILVEPLAPPCEELEPGM